MTRGEWKSKAIKELRAYRRAQISLVSLPDLIERQHLKITRLRISGAADEVQNEQKNLAELESRLREEKITITAIDRVLRSMSNEEYLILDVLFVHPRKNGILELSDRLNLEKTAIYDRRDKALEIFTESLYGHIK